jgi:hypothetical protein
MTNEEVFAMQPGRAMDLDVEREIFGGFVGGVPTGEPVDVPAYSTNDDAALKVSHYLAESRDARTEISVDTIGDAQVRYQATLSVAEGTFVSGIEETLPLAICRAALLSKVDGNPSGTLN